MSDLTDWPNASIAAAAATVVESLAPGEVGKRKPVREKRILMASYAEDFQYLWALQNDLAEWVALGNRHIIIVWDGAPAPGRLGLYNVSEFLTPADWSVMMTLAAKEVPRITIVDFASHWHQTSRTLQTFRHLGRMDPSPLPHVCEVNLSGLRKFFSTLSTYPSVIQPTQEDRSILRALWIALLGERKGTHHAIANIVGPLLLLESMGHTLPKDGSPFPPALRQLIRILHAPDHKRADAVSSEPSVEKPWFDFTSNLSQCADSVVLIDDLAENGWSDVLRAMLDLDGNDPRFRVYLRPLPGDPGTESSSLDMVSYLRGRLDWLRSDEKDHSSPPLLVQNAENPLVFLDIRLFSQSSLEQERRFYKDLLVLAQEFAGLPTTAWPSDLTEKTLEPVRRFAAGEAELESPEHHTALSLLPRLLALADPTLPIILFSSTGRRAVVEPLIPCGNIIFDFEKPRLTLGDWDEAVDRAKTGFKHAMQRVIPLLRGRSFLLKLRKDAAGIGARNQRQPMEGDRSERAPYVEVYIDETGKVSQGAFAVGGLALIYPDEDAAARFSDAMVDGELVWGPSEQLTNPDPQDCLRKDLAFERLRRLVMDPVDEILKKEQAMILGFFLRRASAVTTDDPWDLTSPGCLDNVYRALVLKALEVLLLEVLPQHLEGRPFRCAVYAATRIRTQLDADDSTWWSQLPRRYGVKVISPLEGGRPFFISVRPDVVHPMVAEVLALDPGSGIKVCAARGARLVYYAEKSTRAPGEEELARSAHYLADIFAHAGQWARATKKKPLWTWYERGFWNICDDRFDQSLEACRHARFGRHVEAVIAAAEASELSSWATQRIATSAEALSGPNFIEFCGRLSGDTSVLSERADGVRAEAGNRT